jgi:hypothetical protein
MVMVSDDSNRIRPVLGVRQANSPDLLVTHLVSLTAAGVRSSIPRLRLDMGIQSDVSVPVWENVR